MFPTPYFLTAFSAEEEYQKHFLALTSSTEKAVKKSGLLDVQFFKKIDPKRMENGVAKLLAFDRSISMMFTEQKYYKKLSPGGAGRQCFP